MPVFVHRLDFHGVELAAPPLPLPCLSTTWARVATPRSCRRCGPAATPPHTHKHRFTTHSSSTTLPCSVAAPASFATQFASGHLLGQVLYKHGLQVPPHPLAPGAPRQACLLIHFVNKTAHSSDPPAPPHASPTSGGTQMKLRRPSCRMTLRSSSREPRRSPSSGTGSCSHRRSGCWTSTWTPRQRTLAWTASPGWRTSSSTSSS